MSPASLWVLAFLAGAGFDPGTLKDVAGPPNEVMVLGTPHLSNWPESFEAKQLDPLLDRLAGWKPQAIAVESLSGLQCDALRRFPSRYADTVKDYCWDAAPARQATALDVLAATAHVDRLLAGESHSRRSSASRRAVSRIGRSGVGAGPMVEFAAVRAPCGRRPRRDIGRAIGNVAGTAQ